MVSDQSVSLGALLRQYRAAAGLTQEELAARSGLGVRTIAYLEAGRRGTPRSESLQLLADALSLTPDERAHFLATGRRDDAIQPMSPSTERVGPTPPQPPLHPLVGRAAILTALDTFLRGDGPPAFLLAGEPGIGKTRLLRETGRRAVRAGWTVLTGGCHRAGGEAPYSPLLEALQQHLAGFDPHTARRVLAGCAWLVRLLPELAPVLEPLPIAAILPEHERRLMLDAIARLLATVAGPAGTLLVRRAGLPLRIVGAYRETEVASGSPLSQLVADLARAGLVTHQPLGPLDDAEAASLLTYLLGTVPPDDPETVQHVLERAEGTPFFLVSYAQSLKAGGTETVPWDLAASIRQRVAQAPDAAEVLGIGAVVGRRVPRALLLAVSRQPEERVLAGLDAAVRARLLLEDGPDGYLFAHDVIREVVEEDLGAAQRSVLHGRVAEVLERDPERAGPESLAYHYTHSDISERALPYLERAADEAMKRYAYGQAEASYRELVERLEGMRRTGEAARVREKLGELLRRIGRFAEARDEVTAAIARYEVTGDVAGTGRATALLGLVLDKLGASEEARRRLDEMAQQLERIDGQGGVPSPATAHVWQQLATVHGGQGRYEDMLRAANRAAAIARAVDDDGLRGLAEERRGFALNCLGRLDEGRDALTEAVPLLEKTGAAPEMVGAVANLSENRRLAGELVEALRLGEQALLLATRAFMDRAAMNQHLNQAELLMAIGEWTAARWHITRAEEIGTTGETPAYVATFVPYIQGQLALREGRWDDAAPQLHLALQRAARNNRLIGEIAGSLLAELALLQGAPEEAQKRLTDLLDQPGPNRLLILPQLAWSYVDLGEPQRGLALAREAGREATERHMLLYLPEVRRIEGIALTRLGRREDAGGVLKEGLERARAMPLPYTEARILAQLGLLDRDAGAADEARERLEDALAIFRRLGAAKDAEQTLGALAALSHTTPAAPSQNSLAPVSQNSPAALSQNAPAGPAQTEQSGQTRLTDDQWARIAALLPPRRRRRGRPRADDRQTVEAILYVQRTGCAWADLPGELGNDATAHRRWQEWQAAGLWGKIAALAEMSEPDTRTTRGTESGAILPAEDGQARSGDSRDNL